MVSSLVLVDVIVVFFMVAYTMLNVDMCVFLDVFLPAAKYTVSLSFLK